MYNDKQRTELIDSICLDIMEGLSLRGAIAKRDNKPDLTTFLRWIDNDKDKYKQYVRAKEIMAASMFDELLEIADDNSEDEIVREDGKSMLNHEFVGRSRLRIDTRKWYLSKVLPKVYGDKLDLTTNGETFNAPPPVVNVYSNSAPPLVDNENAIDNNKDV